jgi:hypothetical protein
LALLGCGGPEAEEDRVDPCDDRGDEQLYVIQSMWFLRGDAGVSDGFDLDGADGDAIGCYVPDFTSPDGARGIDNAFAYVLPLLELTEAAAVEGLVQTAIASGELLITLDLSELDDDSDDACVDLAIGRALGPPLLGTDGLVLSGQTFDPNPDVTPVALPDVAMDGGVLRAPVSLSVPLQIFNVSLDFQLLDGMIELDRQPDGSVTGKFAGGVEIQSIIDVAGAENVDSQLQGIVEGLMDTYGDLKPDETGQCTRISMGFSFTAVPAFWFPSQ